MKLLTKTLLISLISVCSISSTYAKFPWGIIAGQSIKNFGKNKYENISLNKVDQNGMYPIHYAAGENDSKGLEILLRRGVDVNTLSKKDNATPLQIASVMGNLDIIIILLKKGALINLRNNAGLTALHYASLNGYLECVKYLIDNGADINAKCINGNTPIMGALMKNQQEIIALLRDNGARE